MLEGISVLCHSSIKFNKDKVIYVDPYNIDDNYNDADIIFITHDHYDHYSEEDIAKIKIDSTTIIAPQSMEEKILNYGFSKNNIILVKPHQEYKVGEIKFETIPAYNNNKEYHPKNNNWVGYIIEIDNVKYYIAGDTDNTEDNKKVQCDVAFVPIGGKFTMDYKEAADLINEIKTKVAVPTHYGSLVGTKEDALNFSKLLNPEIECKIIMK